MKTLLIDNYDSFTFNLAQYIAEVNGEEPVVVKNDEITFEQLMGMAVDNIVISPGPGTPESGADFGVCRDVILRAPHPILGVCLGFQGIATLNGCEIAKAPFPRHGQTSMVRHDGTDLFKGIPSPFQAVRYHSLYIPTLTGSDLIGTAYSDDGILMALRHVRKPVWGVQFHPESILTEHGHQLLRNFRDQVLSLKTRLIRETEWSAPSLSSGTTAPPVPLAVHKGISNATASAVRFQKIANGPSAESVFATLYAHQPPCVWLDSSSTIEGLSRFSFIVDASHPSDYVVCYRSKDKRLELFRRNGSEVIHQSIFNFLQSALAEIRPTSENLPFQFCGGFVGYFGYELKGECGGRYHHDSDLPDAWFLRVSRFIAFDHQNRDCFVVAVGDGDDNVLWVQTTIAALRRLSDAEAPQTLEHIAVSEFTIDQDLPEYIRNIEQALEKIYAGESYQVCLTNRLRCDFSGDPFGLYRVLRRRNPAPFSAFFDCGEFNILSSSPERFLQITPGGAIEARPMKGTIARSSDAIEDRRLAMRLERSEKNRAENLMIVDLLRNDLGRVAQVGSVRVPSLMAMESYATVHQMVSSVRAQLAVSRDSIDCIRAAFPGGSMTGAPKLRTMEILDSLESTARGVYSGALGYMSFNGAVDLNIAIRTIVIAGRKLSIGIGGGIVSLSDPREEFEEALLKGKALMSALEEYVSRTVHDERPQVSGPGSRSRS